MSDDLLKRLRMDVEPSEGDMESAADLIETQAARIAELEAALEKQEAITKDDAKWMMAYHQWCVMNGFPPSSSNLIAALHALVDTRRMGKKMSDLVTRLRGGIHISEDETALRSEAAARIAELEAALNEIVEKTRYAHPMSYVSDYFRIARAALEGKK